MCGGIKKGPVLYRPSSVLPIRLKLGSTSMQWGTKFGDYYNARSENLLSTWNSIKDNRCILEVDSFIEKDELFMSNRNEPLKLAGIFGTKYFMLLTQPANLIVYKFHHRMPVIVNYREEYFLNTPIINFSIFNYDYNLKVA
jgi:putative SOS response-associated peptidase YedK